MPNPSTLACEEDLTVTQQKVLDFMKGYFCKFQRMPTYRDISDAFGWSSPQAAMGHVKALVRKGRLSAEPETARGFQFVGITVKLEK